MKRFRMHAGLATCIAVIYCTTTVDSVDFTVQASLGSDSQNGPSTWAVNIPSLTITLRTTNFPTSTSAVVTAKHQLQDGTEIAMCPIQLTGTTNQCNTCSPQLANFGVVCKRPSSSTVEIIITLRGLNDTRNQSKILLQQGSIPAADWTYDSDSSLITLKGCDLSLFEGAVADSITTCDYNCNRAFSCSSSGYTGTDFTRSCTALASWDNGVATCSLVCDNGFFGSFTEPMDDARVGANGTKVFNCVTCPLTFERTCGTDGKWTDTESFCESDCYLQNVRSSANKAFWVMSATLTLCVILLLVLLLFVLLVAEVILKAVHTVFAAIYVGLVISNAILVGVTLTSAYIAALVFSSIATLCQIPVVVMFFFNFGKLKILFIVYEAIVRIIGLLLVLIAIIVLVSTDTGSYELSNGGVAGVVLGVVGGVLMICSTVLTIMLYTKVLSNNGILEQSKVSPEDTTTADKQRTPLNRGPDETEKKTLKTDYFEIEIFGKIFSRNMLPKKEPRPGNNGKLDGTKNTKTICYKIDIFGPIILTRSWEVPKTKDELAKTMKTVYADVKFLWKIIATKAWEVAKTEEEMQPQ